ncbi:MAG: zf-HC2 domain-containing protein [Cyanobacteria bacterium J06643_13]
MTPQFESFEHENSQVSPEHLPEMSDRRFELISAYIDGELAPNEKKQVQQWIDQDPQVKTVYTQLLALQSQMQNLPTPAEVESVTQITAKVFHSLERRRYRRRLAMGGSAIAASLLTAITMLSGSNNWKFAQPANINENEGNTVMLAVALNTPAINIPKSLNGKQINSAGEEQF